MCVVMQHAWGGGKGESEGILGVIQWMCIYPLNQLLWGRTL